MSTFSKGKAIQDHVRKVLEAKEYLFIEENFKEKIKIDGVFAVTDRHALDFIKRLENINCKTEYERYTAAYVPICKPV